MKHEEYLEGRRQDPEFLEVEKQLKPILDLADDVFGLRQECGWTQAELAERVGTQQANISRLENGLANPTFGFLQKLSEVFRTELVVRLRPQPPEVRTRVVYIHVPPLENPWSPERPHRAPRWQGEHAPWSEWRGWVMQDRRRVA